jgi:hypothetical protein
MNKGANYRPVSDGTRTLIPMVAASVQCEVVGKDEVLMLVREAAVGRTSWPKWQRALSMKVLHE